MTDQNLARKLNIFVAGPSGTTGRAVVKECLDRNHSVTGFSRQPQSWGEHNNYHPVIGTVLDDLPALVKAIQGHDVVISCFAPSHMNGPSTYIGLVEGAWHIIEAVKKVKPSPYLIYVGGAGSLLDRETGVQCIDSPELTHQKYFVNGPIEHLNWLRNVINVMPLHFYYYIRGYAQSSHWLSCIPRLFANSFEGAMLKMITKERSMPHACRAALYFFESNETFEWSFISPPWFYRNGERTGIYGTEVEYQPVDAQGKWLGISNADIAVAILDEAECHKKKWVHWSAYGKQNEAAYYYDNYKGVDFGS